MKIEARDSWLSVFDYLFILRPILFFPGWSTLLAGYLIDTKSRWLYLVVPADDLWLLILSFAFLMGSAFILNQLRDTETDRLNRKLFLISDGIVSRKGALVEAVFLFILAMIIGFLLNQNIGFIFLLFFLITGILYNYRPAVLKDRPWGSLVANTLMGLLAFAAGWSAQKDLSAAMVFDLLPYLFFNTALYLFTILPDVQGDEKIGKRTLAVIYGSENVIIGAFVLFVSGFILTLCMNDFLALLFYVLTLPFFIMSIIRRKATEAVRTTKFGILFFAVAICLRWPVYFLIMLTGFLLTKLYYKYRFNFNYPRFTEE